MSKRVQPLWHQPDRKRREVRLYNSLTRQKELFMPHVGNQVLWYSCGPTVYDAAHMGHARSYITFDILRRVLSDYFHYDVTYVMNITDIDDKIIKRARQEYLFDQYLKSNPSSDIILQDVKNVFTNLTQLANETTDLEKCLQLKNLSDKVHSTINTLGNGIEENDTERMTNMIQQLLDVIRDPFSEYLDSKSGSAVKDDNNMFLKFAQHWEDDFHNDMDALNIKRPNVLTRVSEYIPEIIDYVMQLISSAYAYESNGSVYFDVENFNSKPNHYYAKLVPEAYGDTASLQEGEGSLSCTDKSEKKCANDFALWKASKPGEPSWKSPWGNGRPGWHIECSVMASTILGSTLDIHTGGIDLKFPHHDNEIAQAEAYHDCNQWVNYFLHSGHLTIAGCKMSKSLKNFITIKDALKKYSSRQLRLAFLLHSWKDTLDYSKNTMDMATSYEKLLNEFFLAVKDLLLNLGTDYQIHSFKKWSDADQKLFLRFSNTEKGVFESLCDNVDTRRVLDLFRECINYCNKYVMDCDEQLVNLALLGDIARYMTHILQIFGVISNDSFIGFPIHGSKDKNTDLEGILMPYLKILGDFRHNVRREALKSKQLEILQICDNLRDDLLPEVGVRLEDREDKSSAIKLVDREVLRREKAEKESQRVAEENRKQVEKERKLAEQAKKKALKQIPPDQLFKIETDKYSQFDDKGLPTHDAQGTELSKGLRKKLQKLQLQHKKEYEMECSQAETENA